MSLTELPGNTFVATRSWWSTRSVRFHCWGRVTILTLHRFVQFPYLWARSRGAYTVTSDHYTQGDIVLVECSCVSYDVDGSFVDMRFEFRGMTSLYK